MLTRVNFSVTICLLIKQNITYHVNKSNNNFLKNGGIKWNMKC